jgi:hypothetical protein
MIGFTGMALNPSLQIDFFIYKNISLIATGLIPPL